MLNIMPIADEERLLLSGIFLEQRVPTDNADSTRRNLRSGYPHPQRFASRLSVASVRFTFLPFSSIAMYAYVTPRGLGGVTRMKIGPLSE